MTVALSSEFQPDSPQLSYPDTGMGEALTTRELYDQISRLSAEEITKLKLFARHYTVSFFYAAENREQVKASAENILGQNHNYVSAIVFWNSPSEDGPELVACYRFWNDGVLEPKTAPRTLADWSECLILKGIIDTIAEAEYKCRAPLSLAGLPKRTKAAEPAL